jgi:hypothetical protein
VSNRCQTGKVRHPHKEGALFAARKIGSNRLNVFHCGRCGGWHIGNSRSPFRFQKRLDQIFARDRARDRSGEAIETAQTGSTEGESPVPSGMRPDPIVQQRTRGQ